MSYYFNKVLNVSFADAVTRVVEGLKKEGFGILTEIDVRQTLKRKLDVDFRNYRILGACVILPLPIRLLWLKKRSVPCSPATSSSRKR